MKYLVTILTLIISFWTVNLFTNQTYAESTANALPHKTDFLTLLPGVNIGTTYYPTTTASNRTAYRNALKNKGYTHAYLSVTSGNAGHNYYNDPVGFKNLLQELVNDGIKPVVWLTSDSGTWRNKPISEIKSDLSKFVPVVDSLVNSYEVGLEANEYWTKSETDEIGNYLDSLTSKPLAVHQTPGKWDYCSQSWCDYMILQTNNPTQSTTTTQVKQKVLDARAALGKPVVVGEYHKPNESTSITLGNAGLEACAAGFGNGGTVSKIIWPNGSGCGVVTPSPTPSAPPGSSPSPSPTNSPPTVQNSILDAISGKPTDFIFSYTDPDGPGPYTYTITQQPAHGTLTGTSTDNDWIYTSTVGYTGPDSFKWRVKDGLVNSLEATVNITVSGFKKGDVNHDGVVNQADMTLIITNFSKQPSQVPNYFDPVGVSKINSLDGGGG